MLNGDGMVERLRENQADFNKNHLQNLNQNLVNGSISGHALAGTKFSISEDDSSRNRPSFDQSSRILPGAMSRNWT